MKKAEQQKTVYSSMASINSVNVPMQPASQAAPAFRRSTDPSSAVRSNRYPIPSAGYRMRPAE